MAETSEIHGLAAPEEHRVFHDILHALEDTAPADEFVPYYKMWIDSPVLDAVYLARSMSFLRVEIEHLQRLTRLSQRFFDRYDLPRAVVDPVPSAEFALSRPYLDGSSRFRISPRDDATLYATDCGLRLAHDCLSIDKSHQTFSRWRTALEASHAFITAQIRHQQDYARDGIYAAMPGGAPTIYGTFALVSSLSNYYLIHADRPELPKTPLPLESTPQALVSESLIFRSNDVVGFKRPSEESPSVTATEFAYRIWSLLASKHLLGPRNESVMRLAKSLLEQTTRTLALLLECWDSDSGGFWDVPERVGRMTLSQTRYALQLTRALLELGGVRQPRDLAWLKPSRVLRFVESCWNQTTQQPGFDEFPGLGFPTAFAGRAALDILKLAEVLRLKGDWTPDVDYHAVKASLLGKLSSVGGFVDGCLDADHSVAFMAPRETIKTELARHRRATVRLCGDSFLKRLPAAEPNLSDYTTFFGAVCKAYGSSDYLRRRRVAEFRVQRALEADLRRLCYDPRAWTDQSEPPFGRTLGALRTWPRPHLDLPIDDARVLEQLSQSGIIEKGTAGWLLAISPDTVPAACLTYPGKGVEPTDVPPECAAIRQALGDEFEVFFSSKAVLEAGRQFFQQETSGDPLHIFAATPWLLLPEAYYPARSEFIRRFDWESPFLPKEDQDAAFLTTYVVSLQQAARKMRIHYTWNQAIAERMLRQSYESAPEVKKQHYLLSAYTLFNQAVMESNLYLAYYDPWDPSTRLIQGDWRDFVGFVSSSHVILVMRDSATFSIQAGIRLSARCFKDIIQRLVGSYRFMSPQSKLLFAEPWWANENLLSAFAQLLEKDLVQVVPSGEQLSQPWSFLLHSLRQAADRHSSVIQTGKTGQYQRPRISYEEALAMVEEKIRLADQILFETAVYPASGRTRFYEEGTERLRSAYLRLLERRYEIAR